MAQTTQSVGSAKVGWRVFAEPWAVTFQHVHDAMRGKFGSLAIEQIRRGLVNRVGAGTRYVGTLERLLYRPADTATQTGEKFRLEFRGIEGRKLTSVEFSRLATLFDSKAGYSFRYKGFHVADPALAAQTYDLIFLARTKRTTKQGTNDVYRMAVIPKRWDRTAWLLELDTRTGYPLYAGGYAMDTAHRVTLMSEVIVTSFLTGVRMPNADDPSWWRSIKKIETTPTALGALKKALIKSKAFVAPSLTELPAGFQLHSAEVHKEPFRGDLLAVLIYTDGIDNLFVMERNVPVIARAAEDTINYLNVDGVTHCAFTHRGVSFDVIGRNDRDAVRRASVGIYRRAIRVLR